MRDLLLAGAKGIVHDKTGWTPLHIVVGKENIPFIQLLMFKYPQLVQQKDFQGWTPLHLAADGKNIEVLKILVKDGANLDALSFQGETPSDIANKNAGQAAMAIWLIETQQRQHQLKQFLEHEDSITSLKRHNEQLQGEVIEKQAIIAHLQATIEILEQEASTLQYKVVNRLTLFKSQSHHFQQSLQSSIENEKQKAQEEPIATIAEQAEMIVDEQLEKIQTPSSPSMLL